jgi:hypothetical protein
MGSEDTVTVTVSIGRNIGTVPLASAGWSQFRDAIAGILTDHGATIHVRGASSVGEWQGIEEDSSTFVADLDREVIDRLLQDIGTIGARYGQEAVAVTIGRTVLV